MRYFSYPAGVACLLILSACGGGGSSDSPPANPIQTGVFLDSPVSGLHYETATQFGTTNVSGEFQYLAGESVTFSLGGIILGSSDGSGQVTPLDLVGATSIEDAKTRGLYNRLANLLVFLQSLDRDHNPDNGIDLTDLHTALADEELDFDTIPSIFRVSDYKRIVNEQNGFYQSIKQAQNHFIQSLGVTVSALVPLQDEVDLNGDGEIDLVIDYKYDSDGRLIEVIEPVDMASSMLSYDANGNLINLTFGELDSDSFIFTRTFEYDALGRIISEVDLDESFADNIARAVTTTYDESGNITNRFVQQKQTDFEIAFNRHLSTFDSFYIFPVYDPNVPDQTAFPLHIRGRTGTSSGNENSDYETVFSYDDAGNLSEKTEHQEVTMAGAAEPWATIDIATLMSQGKIQNVFSQVELTQIFEGSGSITTDYTHSESDNTVTCEVSSTGIFSEIFREHTFDNADEIEVFCSTDSLQETKSTVNDKGLITAVEISEWANQVAIYDAGEGYLEDNPLTDGRTKIESRIFEYNNNSQVTKARQDIFAQFVSNFAVITTSSSQEILYTYTETGELQSRHDYFNDELIYSQIRTFQTLELSQLP